MEDYILQMKNITKTFPGVKALDNVTFNVKRGEIHALVGENGAGKSTLMKVLSGIHASSSYSGDIVLNGEVQRFNSIKDSERQGIAIIYQELALCKNLSIAESIFLGSEVKGKFGLIDWPETYHRTSEHLKRVHLDLNPETKIINLGVGQLQLLEICKALSKNASLLILDEPTAALTDDESERLLDLLRELRSNGVSCIYISHKLDEVFSIADTITVLRDGQTIITKPAAEITKNQLISYMVGRELSQMFPHVDHTPGDVVFEMRNWSVNHPQIKEKEVLHNININVRKGEIVGIAGLMGAGRTELMMSLMGAYGSNVRGEVYYNNEKIKIQSSADAIKHGICYVSEDRKRYGLVLMQDIKFNVSLPVLERLSRLGLIDDNELIKEVDGYVRDLRVKTPSIEQITHNLSGGNMQKVVLAKWLMTNPSIMILDEPTRGIDVGAKVEIYNIVNKLVQEGMSVIMISSELPEVLGMSDRIYIMHEGSITGEVDRSEATQELIMEYCTGIRTMNR
ncbi:MAG: ATP-binding cassette domain-containing protein [Clostridia bacterium]|nr:ATP-binding cassette domain-containing protein [Clostridia bacterium]